MIRISGAYNREVLWVAESGVIQYPGGCKKGHKKIPYYAGYLEKIKNGCDSATTNSMTEVNRNGITWDYPRKKLNSLLSLC